MANHQPEQNKPTDNSEKENKKAVNKTLREARQDSAAKDAQKREKQPSAPEDLSPLLDTHEVGSSGGDQRASKVETENKPG